MQVSIHEAIQLTGRSQATIYRLIKHPDSKDFVKKLNDSYTIDKEYLLKVYPARNTSYSDSHLDQARINAHYIDNPHADKMIERSQGEPELLIKQERESVIKLIQEKDKRIEDFQKSIESKNSTINKLASLLDTAHTNLAQLTERTREQNIIIQSLQEKVSYQYKLPEAPTSAQKKKNSSTEQLLMGVAIVSAAALIIFIVMMIYAYVSN
ncbi:hypothetical protein GXP67_15105 [Rhodocytophaga rosea]|uniref:Uncharacterized protein n=1 Tax=Rhodocytophaga rosea TaxID=2704465 RepID=A0A6C0GJK9_9BACT|nr:hypothetical protein [Rhodocytophaga rosea]QHT67873.1 hypothetical protein GXP67_15105 [Rhodocytophaga rosea]